MKIQKLDHIALYMGDRDAAAAFLVSHLDFHIVDRTERYTLVGAGGRIGKLTLFDAPEGTEPTPGVIERINVRVADPDAAAGRLPVEAGAESRDGGYVFSGPEGLPLALVSGEGGFTDYDLEGLVLRGRGRGGHALPPRLPCRIRRGSPQGSRGAGVRDTGLRGGPQYLGGLRQGT